MPKRRRSRSLTCKGTSAAAAKRRRRQEDAQHSDSRLALAHLVHYLASNLQVPLWCHQGCGHGSIVVRAPSRAAVEEKPYYIYIYTILYIYIIAERREHSEANNRVLFEIPRYSYIYIYIYIYNNNYYYYYFKCTMCNSTLGSTHLPATTPHFCPT